MLSDQPVIYGTRREIVLVVGMNHDDDAGPFGERRLITGFLIGPVAQVIFVLEHVQAGRLRAPRPCCPGAIITRIILSTDPAGISRTVRSTVFSALKAA